MTKLNGQQRRNGLRHIAWVAGALAGITLCASMAEAQQRARRPLAPPLTIQRRSFLDAGPIVPVGSLSNYMTVNTILNVPIYASYAPDLFGGDVLPRRFDPPGRPQPLFEFSTGRGGP
ncbi:MAG: hypothetical protein JWL62_818 [Hyphomicrobiales bacterium]|nr:hypothetical protein [Hyphomicrobiales bacterium]